MNTIRLLALLLLLASTPDLRAAAPTGKPQQLTSPDQVHDGLAKSDWATIRAGYEAGRHAFAPVAGGWQARNPGQQWLTHLDGQGFVVEPSEGGWQWGLQLKCYGFPGSERAIDGVPAVKAEGQRLNYAWDAAVEEWFVNDARGLEHGYTVRARPTASADAGAPLQFDLAVRGSLAAEVEVDGLEVKFRDAAGAVVLRYGGLKVWDADGKVLSACFAPTAALATGALRLLVDDRSARYPLTIDPIAQRAYLKPLNTGAGDQFGWSVAVSSNTVVVGAIHEDGSGTGVNPTSNEGAADAGAAYVFVRSGTSWSQQAYLKASNTDVADEFGWSVAVSGDTVVVGARFESGSGTGVNPLDDNLTIQSGAAYVFVRSGTSWSQQAYLKASNTGTQDRFGQSVAVSGDTVVVGSREPADVNQSGAAYVFVRSGTNWNQQAYLEASNAGGGDNFGQSVAVSGDTVVVGAWFESGSGTGVNPPSDEGAVNAGAAYVFVRSGTSWSEQAYLKASNTGTEDRFGQSVAVSGDTVIVGGPFESGSGTGVNPASNEGASGSGAAYVFVRSGTTWSQEAYLKASNTAPGDLFGYSVAVLGDTVAVGAIGEDGSGTGVNAATNELASGSGAAYVFVRRGTSWSQEAYVKASNTGSGDQFGYSVAMSGDTLVVGARLERGSGTGVNPVDNNLAEDAGAAYVFSVLPPFTITVNSLADSGAGSLRQTIADVHSGDTIIFGVTGTITLTSGELIIDKSLILAGPGADNLTISGNHQSRVFSIGTGNTVVLADLSIQHGTDDFGGGIASAPGTLALNGCIISGNSASQQGGGIYSTSTLLTLKDCTLSGNSAAAGGGIALASRTVSLSGTVSLNRCTLSSNSATTAGGGVYNSDRLIVRNSTLAGNSAGSGGGLYTGPSGTTTLVHATVTGNSANVGGGIALTEASSSLSLQNSLVAGNTASTHPDIRAVFAITSGGYNFIGVTNGIAGGLVPTDLRSATPGSTENLLQTDLSGAPLLTNNGGPTYTAALVPGSPAIDAGNNAGAVDAEGTLLVIDQARQPRFYDGDGDGYAAVDIGAYELQNSPPTISFISDATVTNTIPASFTFAIQDLESSASGLMLSGKSSQPALVSDVNIEFSGSGADRMVTITPTPGLTGQTTITVTVSDGLATASRSFVLTIIRPLALTMTTSAERVVMSGAVVILRVLASGDGPYFFQWRYNGADLPGATNSMLVLMNVQPADSGSYAVLVTNQRETVLSETSSLIVLSPSLGFANDFADAITVMAAAFVGRGTNVAADKETGEPNHAGKVGGKSVWINWQAPQSGQVTFSTRGSSFDTLLAVYTGDAVNNLVEVASDEDSAGFYASRVSFRAQMGTIYHLAIDGLAGAAGNILLSWTLDGSDPAFVPPRITTHPRSQTVLAGGEASFSVVVALGSAPSSQLHYQWYRNSQPMAGATTTALTVSGVDAADLGVYVLIVTVQGRSGPGSMVESLPARLEIGNVVRAPSEDKFEDLFREVGGGGEAAPASAHARLASVVAGIINSQTLNNLGSSTQPCERGVGGTIGGASRWLSLQPDISGTLMVDTAGSAIPTALAAYSATNLCDPLGFNLLAQSRSSTDGGTPSVVRFPVTAGTSYQIAVSGIDGAQGIIRLNWTLGTPPTLFYAHSVRAYRVGDVVNLNVATLGSPLPTYQWQRNGRNLAQETNTTLVLPHFELSLAGTYSLVASNFAGIVTNTIGAVDLLELRAVPTSSNGLFQMLLVGKPGGDYVVEVNSNDFVSPWQSISTNRATNGTFLFTDPRSPLRLNSFYRALAK